MHVCLHNLGTKHVNTQMSMWAKNFPSWRPYFQTKYVVFSYFVIVKFRCGVQFCMTELSLVLVNLESWMTLNSRYAVVPAFVRSRAPSPSRSGMALVPAVQRQKCLNLQRLALSGVRCKHCILNKVFSFLYYLLFPFIMVIPYQLIYFCHCHTHHTF